ncbi:MAG: cell division protein FtsZ [Prevotellaceae bacterium]|nr:cell division protein FtsZ [Prevotellaceae bacterium]
MNEISNLPPIDFGIVEDRTMRILKVVGVGGAGCNAVRNMYDEGIEGVSFAVCNTDSKVLAKSPVPVKLQLGEGLGAGANPEVGKSEAENNIDDIRTLLNDGTKMVFITAGMGGGTGTGAAPVVAQIAQELGILTVAIVTIPFYFERKKKIVKALKGVEEMRKYVDAMLVINNERLCDVYSDSPISLNEAFKRADDVLKEAVKGISELITFHSDGNINLDFRDVETTTRKGGGAIMAIGRASGNKRIERAIIDALDSPLLCGNDINKAKKILFNIYASTEHQIFVNEMQEIDDFFDQLDPDIEVIWGTSTDDSLGEDAKVTILATGIDNEFTERKEEQRNVGDEHFEQLIKDLYKPVKKSKPEIKKEEVVEIKEEVKEPEPPFVVVAPKVEPAAEPIKEEKSEEVSEPKKPTILDRWKAWLRDNMDMYNE